MEGENRKYIPKEESVDKKENPIVFDGEDKKQEDRKEKDREKLLERLQYLGCLEIIDGIKIWDIKKLKKINLNYKKRDEENKDSDFLLYNIGSYKKRINSRLLAFDLLKNEKGVSREEFEKNKKGGGFLHEKKLFYIPESIDDLFDIEKLKNEDDSLMEYWEFCKGNVMWNKDLINLPSGEKIFVRELFLMRKIFKTLKAKRDERGNLIYWDNEKEKWKNLTGKIIYKKFRVNLGSAGKKGDGGFGTSPSKYILEKCPNILQRKVVKPEDFTSLSEKSGQTVRVVKKIQQGGLVWLNGAYYSLGKDFAYKNKPENKDKFFVVILSKGLAGILTKKEDGSEVLKYVFKIRSKKEVLQKKEEIEKSKQIKNIKTSTTVYFSIKETNIIPYKITGENKMFKNESPEEYAERIRMMANFEYIQKISLEFYQQTGIAIHKSLRWREQQWLATVLKEKNDIKKEIIENTKKFGINFLRSFLSCEYSINHGDKIIDITSNLKENIVRNIFSKYVEMVDVVDKVLDQVNRFGEKELNEKQLLEIKRNMEKRGRDVLIKSAKQIKDNIKNKDDELKMNQNINDEIDSCQSDIILFAGVFKVLSKNQNIEFSEIKGVELISKESKDLKEGEKEEMRNIFLENRKDNGFSKEYLDGRSKELDDKGSKFYILKVDQKIVSFVRFNELENGNLYASFLNTKPLIKGNAIGSAFLKVTLEKEGFDKKIEIKVRTENRVAKNYQKDFGFEIVGDPFVDKNGKEYYKMIRKPIQQQNSEDLKMAA